MKIRFNPPLKPWTKDAMWKDIEGVQRKFFQPFLENPIQCPQCGSTEVWVCANVIARAWVNLNTWRVEDEEAGECSDMEYARRYEDRHCRRCDHEWSTEATLSKE